jgi:hypothetical protein
MAGFKSGYVVVISTREAIHAAIVHLHTDTYARAADMHEIGREQFCAKFHNDELRDIAHCPAVQRVATCGDNCIKLIDMTDNWKVQQQLQQRLLSLLHSSHLCSSHTRPPLSGDRDGGAGERGGPTASFGMGTEWYRMQQHHRTRTQ